MKKLALFISLAAISLLLTIPTLAQDTKSPDKSANLEQTQTSPAPEGTFVDKNKDGICDNRPQGGNQAKCTFVDKNGDGKCDNQKGNGCCNKENCCGKGYQGKNCPGHGQANCCGKGNQYHNCMRNCQSTGPAASPGK